MPEEKLPIGQYNPDATEENAYYHRDEHNLIVTYSSNKGLGDSIGGTLDCYMPYNDPELIEGIENCWQYRHEHKGKDYKGKMVGVRHPDYVEKEGLKWYELGRRMSRDHFIYTIVALRLWEIRTGKKSEKLEQIIKATPFGIRSMARWTLELILWTKSIRGNKVALWWYLAQNIVIANLIYIPLWKLGNKICGWGEEVEQEDWKPYPEGERLQDQPKYMQWISKITIPSYALMFAGTLLYVVPDTFPRMKKALMKSNLKMVGKTNYVQQMLFGVKDIPRERIESYKSMKGGRWSGYLNKRNDRNMRIHDKNYIENVIDVDLARFLYNETQLN